eukprot:6855199-Pyramimonas_sp.AAC.1
MWNWGLVSVGRTNAVDSVGVDAHEVYTTCATSGSLRRFRHVTACILFFQSRRALGMGCPSVTTKYTASPRP